MHELIAKEKIGQKIIKIILKIKLTNVKIKTWTDRLRHRVARVKEQSGDLRGKIKGRTTKKKIKMIQRKYEIW